MDNISLVKKLPPMLYGNELEKALTILPEYATGIVNEDAATRLIALSDMYRVFVPTQMSKEIYSKMYGYDVEDVSFEALPKEDPALFNKAKDILKTTGIAYTELEAENYARSHHLSCMLAIPERSCLFSITRLRKNLKRRVNIKSNMKRSRNC
jgi:hypothetical protein